MGGSPAMGGSPVFSGFPAILERSEKEIRDLQQLAGFDLYWKLYFALT
jgi:hypothetical protein